MKKKRSPIHLLESAAAVNQIGFLKTAVKCYASIYYDFQEEIQDQLLTHNNTRALSVSLNELGETESKDLINYLEIIYPLNIEKNSNKIKINKNEEWVPILIEYDLYKKIIKLDSGITPSKILVIKKRLEEFLSTPWQVTLKRLLKWPTTNAPLGLEDFFPSGWQETGLLSSSGYIVGKSGASEEDRKLILSNLVEKEIKLKGFRADYLSNWGGAATLDRLLKIARTIAVLCRNAKGSPHDFTKAIKEWESDLLFLKNKYFYDFLNLDKRQWPTT